MITLDSVTRTYGEFTAVDHVSFTAHPGRVTGFLGPNGAGKSTTMRIIVGLTHATTGSATVSGRRYVDLPNPGLEVGVLLDASAQHAGRTGREILTIAQRFMGLPKIRVDEMLDLVGLTPGEVVAPRARLLARHAAAARAGDGADRRPVGADPRRARQRARPGRHPVDAWPAPGLRRPRRHRAALLAPAPRDRGDRRRPRRDRQRDGSWPRAPSPTCSPRPGRWCARPSPSCSPPPSARRHHVVVRRDRRPAGPGRRRPGRAHGLRGRRTRPRAARRPTAPGWRRCSSSSPQTPSATARRPTRPATSPKEHSHDHRPAPRAPPPLPSPCLRGIPLARITATELRKMLDTRSGFWTMASIAVGLDGHDRHGDPLRRPTRTSPTAPSPRRSAFRCH